MTVAGLALRGPLLALLAQAPSAPSAPAYRVGPGDVLEVMVAGRPDLARLPTVQTTGTICMPHLDEVAVEGLTAAEIGAKLTDLISRYEPGRPAVTVQVKEYQSQFVWVLGEVNRPGRKVLRAPTRLLDALLEAGGFTAQASGEVAVQRPERVFEDGTAVRRFRFERGSPTPRGFEELETPLRNHDVVTASRSRYVTVTGEVVRPGRYPLEGETTVTAVLSAAGGLTRFGNRRVMVSRRDPATGQVRILEADLAAIEKGQEPDLVLRPDDRIEIKRRLL